MGYTFVWRYIALYWSRCVLLQNVTSDRHDKLTRKKNIYVVDVNRKTNILLRLSKRENQGCFSRVSILLNAG